MIFERCPHDTRVVLNMWMRANVFAGAAGSGDHDAVTLCGKGEREACVVTATNIDHGDMSFEVMLEVSLKANNHIGEVDRTGSPERLPGINIQPIRRCSRLSTHPQPRRRLYGLFGALEADIFIMSRREIPGDDVKTVVDGAGPGLRHHIEVALMRWTKCTCAQEHSGFFNALFEVLPGLGQRR